MKKRWCALAAAVLLSGMLAFAGGETLLMWNEVNGEEYGAAVGARVFGQKLEELSGGKLILDLYLNEELGSEAESMQGIRMGTLDFFRGNASSLAEYGLDLMAATGQPFLFESMEDFHAFAESEEGKRVLDSAGESDCGFLALGWMVEGPRSLFITRETWERIGCPEEISLDSLRGLTIRSGNALIAQTLEALGMTPVSVGYRELKKTLQAGNLDGAENGVAPYLEMEFYQPAPYFIPDAHLFGCGVILMSRKSWDALSPEEQGWIREASRAAGEACYAYNLEHEQACRNRFAELGVRTLPLKDPAEWREACQPLYEQRSGAAQELIRKIQQ